MERQLIRLPSGPAPQTGLAQMMPGPEAAQVNPRTVSAGRVRINTQAPETAVRLGGVQASGEQLAQGEMQTARATMQTGQAFAQTITDIGQGISQVAQRIIIARESAELMEADAVMKGAAARYKAGLPEDPGGWKGGFDGVVESVRGDLLGDPDKRMSKPLKRKLEQNIKAWEAENRVGLETMAIRQNLNIAKAKSDFAFDQAIERGDLTTAQQISQVRVASGLSTSDIESMRLQQASEQIYRNALAVQIERDPFGAEQLITSKPEWMTELESIKYGKAIKQSQHFMRLQEMDVLENALATDPNMPQAKFEDMLGSMHLTPVQANKFRQDWQEGRRPDFTAMAKLRSEIQKISPQSKDEEVYNFVERIKAEVHKSYQPQFIEALKERTGPNQEIAAESALSSNGANMLMIARRLISATVQKEKDSNPYIDIRQMEKAQVVLEKEATDYLLENPNATQNDVFKMLESLQVPANEDLMKAMLEPGIYDPKRRTQAQIIKDETDGLQLKPAPFPPVWKEVFKDVLSVDFSALNSTL